MFTFTPKSEEEIALVKAMGGLLPDGVYPFVIKEIAHKISSTGNPMLEVKLSVYDKNKHEHVITDYIVSTEKMAYKLRHFCECIGLMPQYLRGAFNPQDCVKRRGSLELTIQKGKPKADGTGYYSDKNVVKDYCKPDHLVGKKSVEKPQLIDDDISDIPF